MPVLKIKNNGVWEDVAGASGHTHEIDDIVNFPSSLPADGGDADTLDGKHAEDFASSEEFGSLKNLVGNTSVSEQIDAAIANMVDSAPEALDTLNELAAALGDDPNFATTIATQIGSKANAEDLTSHTNSKSNPHEVTASQVGAYSKTEIDNMEFITTADIDAICGTTIQFAREVMF